MLHFILVCYNYFMFIKKLEIKNFRNYSDVNVEFNSNKILFIGKNAQGKTNLLEAVYFL